MRELAVVVDRQFIDRWRLEALLYDEYYNYA